MVNLICATFIFMYILDKKEFSRWWLVVLCAKLCCTFSYTNIALHYSSQNNFLDLPWWNNFELPGLDMKSIINYWRDVFKVTLLWESANQQGQWTMIVKIISSHTIKLKSFKQITKHFSCGTNLLAQYFNIGNKIFRRPSTYQILNKPNFVCI